MLHDFFMILITLRINMVSHLWLFFIIIALCYCDAACAFQQPHNNISHIRRSTSLLYEMKRPILDRLATFVFKLENDRVANSSVEDDKGRTGGEI